MKKAQYLGVRIGNARSGPVHNTEPQPPIDPKRIAEAIYTTLYDREEEWLDDSIAGTARIHHGKMTRIIESEIRSHVPVNLQTKKEPMLLPCPFCGHSDAKLPHSTSNTRQIECLYCGAEGPKAIDRTLGDKDTFAVEFWNRRKKLSPEQDHKD